MSSIFDSLLSKVESAASSKASSLLGKKMDSQSPDNVDPNSDGGLINQFTGFLSKAADTALDLYAIKESGKQVGSSYPTGQVNPAAVASAQQSAQQVAVNTANPPASAFSKYLPYILGGVGIVALLYIVKSK